MIRDIDALTASVYENKLEQERARSRQREAEFKMLASQINPHFLFNTLESIRMKARACGDTEVADMVKMLAKLMRHSIEVRDSLVPVKDELSLTEYYLKLQHYRFGDAVQFTVTAESGCEQLFILPLLVQPLVENAFVHGLKERRMGGRITVHAEADDAALTITVADNGVGMTPAALDALRQSLASEDFDHSHIGVANVHHRIRMFYGADWGLTVDSAPGQGTTAALRNERENRQGGCRTVKTGFFAVAAAALLLAGCAAQPAAPTAQTESADPLTLTFFNIDGVSDPWTDPVALKFTEVTGVSLKTEYPARGSDDAINLMLEDGDYSDLIYAKEKSNRLIEAGALIDLAPLVDEYKHKKRCSASALHLRKCYFTLSHCPMQRPAQYILRGADRRS